jgi:hypothetical protein
VSGPNEKPHAGGRGAGNNTGTWASASGLYATRNGTDALCLALAAVDASRQQLNRYATATDSPAWQAVDAADLLDVVSQQLADALTGETCHVDP